MDWNGGGERSILKPKPSRAGWVWRLQASKNGGRDWDRTSDPHDVNVVLYR